MNKEILRYLRNHCSTEPKSVDRLIVSSFLQFNNIKVIENRFIQEYVITEEQIEEYTSFQKFHELVVKKLPKFDFEVLIEFFEFVVSPADKVITGAIYTPQNIREFIIDEAFLSKKNQYSELMVADIACGCGSFLCDLSKRIKVETHLNYDQIFTRYIYGLDIQEYSVTRSKILLSLLAISEGEDIAKFSFNLFVGDALNFTWTDVVLDFKGFSIIVGNPPYVCSRNISESTKQYLSQWEVCSTGHPDLYIPFFQIGLENLHTDGFLGYITMNSFFKSVNGRALRSYFQNRSYKFKIIDFGNSQVFASKSTYTCICFMEKKTSSIIEYAKKDDSNLDNSIPYNQISYAALNPQKGWNLQKQDLIEKIESTGVPFGELYHTRNGIATLKNYIYIFNPIAENDECFFLQNGKVYEIEKSICKDIINPNKLTTVEDIDSLREKVIFPYYFEDNQVKLYDERTLKCNFPKAFKYLKAKRDILSTRDKGNGNYENWYAFGRNQSLEKIKNKLFFPHITPKTPNYVLSSDENLLFHNGLAVVSDDEVELLFLQKLMSSKLFWFYVEKTSKPYGSGYYSLSRNYIKNFGVCDMTSSEKDYIIQEDDINLVNEFFDNKYGIR